MDQLATELNVQTNNPAPINPIPETNNVQPIPQSPPTYVPAEKKRKRDSEIPTPIEDEDDIIAIIENGGKRNPITHHHLPAIDPVQPPPNSPTQEPTHSKTQPRTIHPFFTSKKAPSVSQPNPQQSKNEICGTPTRERSKSSTYPNAP